MPLDSRSWVVPMSELIDVSATKLDDICAEIAIAMKMYSHKINIAAMCCRVSYEVLIFNIYGNRKVLVIVNELY